MVTNEGRARLLALRGESGGRDRINPRAVQRSPVRIAVLECDCKVRVGGSRNKKWTRLFCASHDWQKVKSIEEQ